MGSHPTNKRRKAKQKAKRLYSRLREALQLSGELPTVPEGAVRNEVVPAWKQDEQRFPALDRKAIRECWDVPDQEKPKVVDRLVAVVLDKESSAMEKVRSAMALLQADQRQYESDRCEAARRAEGRN